MSTRLTDASLLERLVAFDTTSTHTNLPLLDFVESYVPSTIRRERFLDETNEKACLLLTTGPGDASGGLTLCGHVDVVPAEEEGWASDPWTLTERDGAYHARGACDMKGFVALAINALIDASTRDLDAPLALLLTCDEEVGSLGAQWLAPRLASHALPRATIIGEPTSLRVVRMHKGHLKIRIETQGKAGHSGKPASGRNAVEPAAAIVGELAAYRAELERIRTDTADFFPDAPFPVLNVARIAGGGAVNVIPDRCAIDLGVRLLPGMESGPVIERIRSIAGDASVTVVNDNPPMLLAADAGVHQRMCALMDQRDSYGEWFASDGGVLSQDVGLACVLWGPGDIAVAHQANEFLPRPEFERASGLLRQVIGAFCGG